MSHFRRAIFRLDVCGPKTRYGIANGAWLFIPATGRAYGLGCAVIGDNPALFGFDFDPPLDEVF
jgi:hypothetical protein